MNYNHETIIYSFSESAAKSYFQNNIIDSHTYFSREAYAECTDDFEENRLIKFIKTVDLDLHHDKKHLWLMYTFNNLILTYDLIVELSVDVDIHNIELIRDKFGIVYLYYNNMLHDINIPERIHLAGIINRIISVEDIVKQSIIKTYYNFRSATQKSIID